MNQTGSNNPLALDKNTDKIPFHPYFTGKDILGFAVIIILLSTPTLWERYILGDPDNFTPANPLASPVHIRIRNPTINPKQTRRDNRTSNIRRSHVTYPPQSDYVFALNTRRIQLIQHG